MKPVSNHSNARSKASKLAVLVASTSIALAPLALGQASPATADTASVSDSTGECQLSVSSPSITIDPTSVSVSLLDEKCVVKFLAVGSYSVTIPGDVQSVDYLVVAGGGGGGSGGGGGGGVLQGTDFAVTPGASLDVSVGGGGTGGSGGGGGSPVFSTAGGSSVFASITALGGGSGGQSDQHAGEGASGGGSQYDCIDVSCQGAGVSGQGFNGASSGQPGYGGGGGGGGAGEAAEASSLLHIGGKGGDGVSSSITGTPTFYGGGGGGGVNSNDGQYCGLNAPATSDTDYFCSAEPLTSGGGVGGAGGGGRGSSWGFTGGTQGEMANGSAGEPNTGGGGGGTDPEDAYAYAGGSGIVVLRFSPKPVEETVYFEMGAENRNLADTGATAWQLPVVGVGLIALGSVALMASNRSRRRG